VQDLSAQRGNRQLAKKTFSPEQIVATLRQIEVLLSEGKTGPLACKEAGIVVKTRSAFGVATPVWPKSVSEERQT
jgi:hypothetical protein